MKGNVQLSWDTILEYKTPETNMSDALYLEHLDRTSTFLDRRFATQTLTYIAVLWHHPVHLLTGNEQGKEVSLTAPAS